jgi:hypothetical protein
MVENKNIVWSRSMWSMLLPIFAIIGQQAGLGENFSETLNQAFLGIVGVVSLVLNILHQRRPEPTTLRVE